MPRLSLRYKLLVGVLVLLLPVLGLFLLGVRAEYQQRRERVLDDQVRTATALAALVDTIFDDCIDLGRALANDPVIRSFDPTVTDPHLQRLAQVYPQYVHLAVFNATGENVGSSVAGDPRPDASQFWFFRQAMATGQPVISEVRQALGDRRPIVVIVVPILDGERAIGTVHLAIDLRHLPPRLADVLRLPGDTFFVVDPQGRVAFHSLLPDLPWEKRDESQVPEIRAALAGQTVRSDNYRSPLLGEARWLGAVRSPKHGWIAGLSVSSAAVYGSIEEGLRRQLAALALIALFGIVGAWALSTYLVRPLARLAELSQALGRGELGRRADVRTRDELEELGEAFNRMAERLQATLGTLAAERARFQTIFEKAPHGILFVEAATGRLLANPEAIELLGLPLTPEAGRAQYVGSVCRPDGRALSLAELPSSRALQGQLVPDEELLVVRPDGRRVPLLVSAAPVPGLDGRVAGAVVVLQDIAERKRAEEALRESEERFRSLLQTAVSVIILLSPDRRILEFNPEAERVFGRKREEVLGQDYFELFLPEAARRGVAADMEKVLAGEPTRGFENEVTARDGTVRVFTWSINRVLDFRGQPVGVVAVGQDITERKRAEKERERLLYQLASEQSWLRTVIERSPVGMILLAGSRGERIVANRWAEEIFGHPIPLAVGTAQPGAQVCRPGGTPLLHEELASTRALRGETIVMEEQLIRRPDGREVPVLANAGPIQDAAGTILGTVVVFEDITPLKELERLREEWTSLIAHDLRQPVTVIIGYAGLLAKQTEQQAPAVTTKVQHILASATQLNRMIADLLDVSRIEARRLKLERQAVDLPALVRAVVERTAEVTQGHAMRVEVKGEIPRLAADPGRLEQVLGNLLSNAAKYGYPGTEIRVEVERRADEVEVTVANQGKGIPPEELPKLFTRFHRTRWAKDEHLPGLGLGLYITKGLVEAHGGRIWAESVPGQATAFHFTLPVAAPTAV